MLEPKKTEILESAIKSVCNNNGIFNKDHVGIAVARGKNLFTVAGDKDIIPIIDQGINKYWTLPEFVKNFKKDLPAIETNKNDKNMKQLNEYAKSGDMKGYRQARKKMRQ